MGKPATVNDVGTKLCEVLGLDPTDIRRISFTWKAGYMATIEIEKIVKTDAGLESVFEEYELRKKE